MRQAKARLSRLLQLVEEGETVVIGRNERPVAELAPARLKGGFPFGMAREHLLVPPGHEWWQPMSGREVDEWIEDRGEP